MKDKKYRTVFLSKEPIDTIQALSYEIEPLRSSPESGTDKDPKEVDETLLETSPKRARDKGLNSTDSR